MSRPRKNKASMRVQLRLDQKNFALCDCMTSEEISEVIMLALQSGIRPGRKLGASVQALIRPEKMTSKTIARIALAGAEGRTIQIVFPEKDKTFRLLVKSFLYEWSGWCWERTFQDVDQMCDRASEIAHNILLAGFPVQVEHSEIRDRAITGQYESEAFRLVKLCVKKPYEGWFVFEYPKDEKHWYDKITRLTAAKYANGRLQVPAEYFAEVEDFAEQNGFALSEKAKEALEQARSLWESALLVMPAKKKRRQTADNPLNNFEVEIPDALKDDLT